MQKVYLLLRGNQQTGPFSLDEILQFDLKPFDLIWIEGRSAGWYYPQEIPALQPYLSLLKPTPASTPAPVQASVEKPSQTAGPEKVFVSMPSNAIKEEPTPRPSFSSLPDTPIETPTFPALPTLASDPATLKTSYAKSLNEVETDYMNWAYNKKQKRKTNLSVKGIVAACFIVGLAFASWKLLQPSNENPGKTPPELPAFVPAQNELPADSAAEKTQISSADNSSTHKKGKPTKAAAVAENKQLAVKKEENAKPQQETVINATRESEEIVTPKIKELQPVVMEEKKSEPVASTDAPKERKKLRDKIADLFKKKPTEKKDEAQPVEEESGRREATHRESGSSLAQMVTVRFTIPNEWMMGINGAKATLTNRGGEIITKAVIEVVYYNDDNEVLTRRIVNFSNIKSKQSQTVSVPDHQTATRLEYNVISVTGSSEPFAKR